MSGGHWRGCLSPSPYLSCRRVQSDRPLERFVKYENDSRHKVVDDILQSQTNTYTQSPYHNRKLIHTHPQCGNGKEKSTKDDGQTYQRKQRHLLVILLRKLTILSTEDDKTYIFL